MAIFNSGNRDTPASSTTPPPPPEPAYPAPTPAAKRTTFSVLGPDIIITGNITATADLHIDGRVEGDIDCASLVQGPQSTVKGAIKADKARLAGKIEGSVRARQLNIERGAKIEGDVEYEAVAIESGAAINGRLKHLAQEVIPPTPPKPLVLTSVTSPDEETDGYDGGDETAAA